MNAPKISVLIPTYNYARFLPEAVESVLAQDFSDFELLIADDGSTDNTAEVVAPYCQRDRRISFTVNRTNLGMVGNWNACLKKARGDYVKYLFGDDKLAASNSLGTLAAMLDSNPSVALATSARQVIDEASKPLETWDKWKKLGVFDGTSVMLECLRTADNLVGEPSAAMFRRSLAQRGFNPAYRQLVDLEMWFHLLEQGGMAYTTDALCCFRRHSAQQTEVNRTAATGRSETLIGHTELLSLFSDCADKPWYRQSAATKRAANLWTLRQWRPSFPPDAFKVVEKQLRENVPAPLLFMYWLAHKTARPFENLKRSFRKRLPGRNAA